MLIFKIQLLISFLIGGIFIAFQTLIAERIPLRFRGMILTIPSTLAIGLLFVGLTKTPQDVFEIARVYPAALAPDYFFVMIFAILSKIGFWVSLLGAFATFALTGSIFILFSPQSPLTSFIIGIGIILICYLLTRNLPQVSALKPYPMNAKHIAGRSIIGGTVVLTIVFLAKTLGNVWGALFAAFPAAFTSTFIIYYHLQGKSVIPSVARSLFFPGSLGFMLYAWIAGLTFPAIGIWLGTLASYAGTFIFFWLYTIAERHIKKRKGRLAEARP